MTETEALFGRMLDGGMADDEIAATLVDLAERGETAADIAGAVLAMRARMKRIAAPMIGGVITSTLLTLVGAGAGLSVGALLQKSTQPDAAVLPATAAKPDDPDRWTWNGQRTALTVSYTSYKHGLKRWCRNAAVWSWKAMP